MRILFLLSISCFLVNSELDAQLLKKIIDKTTDKVVDGAANMAAEKISDAVARKVLSSLDKTFDDYIDQVIQQDSFYKSKYGDSTYQDLAERWAGSLNRAANVPDSYDFDISFISESRYKKDVNQIEMYFYTDKPILGFKQIEDGEVRYMVFDTENDLTALYTIDASGKKTAQALPNLFSFGAAMAVNVEDAEEDINCQLTGKSAMFAGYKSKELKCEDEEYEYTTYFSDETGIDWNKSFAIIFERYASTKYKNTMDANASGMFMASFTKSKKGKKKDEVSWEVLEVNKTPFQIKNSDYTFTGIEDGE